MLSCPITLVFSCLLAFPFNPTNISSNRCPQLTRTSLSSSSFLYPTSLAILFFLLSPYCSKSLQFLLPFQSHCTNFLFQSHCTAFESVISAPPFPISYILCVCHHINFLILSLFPLNYHISP